MILFFTTFFLLMRENLLLSINDFRIKKDNPYLFFGSFGNNHEKNNIVKTKIDKMVYQLYGLTEEEIKIVEGS
jgi:hypothetical protein